LLIDSDQSQQPGNYFLTAAAPSAERIGQCCVSLAGQRSVHSAELLIAGAGQTPAAAHTVRKLRQGER
jgi:hypothetical protein